MERKAYLEQKQNSEKGKMKARLWEWGEAKMLCAGKETDLLKIEKLKEEQRSLWEKVGPGEEGLLKKAEGRYDREKERIRREIAEIMEKKAEIDWMLLQLEQPEKQFIELRFEKGYGFDYIGMKLYLSRASLFRMQDRVLEKLIAMEKELETA